MTGRATVVGEDTQALARFVFGLTLGVGAMAAVAAAFTGQLTILTAVPTVVLAVMLRRWRGDELPHPLAGYSAALVWLVICTVTRGDTLVVPLGMAAISVTLAVGPQRVADWLGRQWVRDPDVPPSPAGGDADAARDAVGWIEEDGRIG